SGTRGVMSLSESTTGDERTTLLALTGAVACVLLIACANVANVLIERADSRRREIATRLALGAGAGRLIRQMLVESVWLALAGSAAGIIAAHWLVSILIDLIPPGVPNARLVNVNLRVEALSLAAGWLAGLLAGLLPALRAARPQLAGTLHE